VVVVTSLVAFHLRVGGHIGLGSRLHEMMNGPCRHTHTQPKFL
jgi:hypothetical protein